MDGLLKIVIFLSTTAVLVTAGEYCTTDRVDQGFYYTYEYQYCSYGCCGDYPNEYCCGVYIWIIIVSVIGGLIFLSCCVAVVCCVVKSNGHKGRVVQPTTGVTMITASNMNSGPSYGYPQPGGYQPPPSYNQPPGYQPSPGFQPGFQPGYNPGFQQQPGASFNTGNQYPPLPNQPPNDPAFPPTKANEANM